MSKPLLYLIDSSSYIFRAYHAIRNLSTSKGFPTNAIFGFTSMLFSFLKEYQPDYLGLVFDSKGETFRNKLYPLYKANRKEPPDDLKVQFPKVFEIVEAFQIPKFQVEGYEADDIMGTISKRMERCGINAVLVTGDKDFYQLVSGKISLLDTMRNKKTGIKEVVDKYGVSPDKITDIFALAGDSVDNIPGVRGIGEKTASELIKEYGSLENLFKGLDKVRKRQKELIEANVENAMLSKDLATIKTDVPGDFHLENFKYKGFDKGKLADVFDELEFRSLLREIGEYRESEFKADENRSKESQVSYESYELVLREEDMEGVIERIKETKEVSLDLETTSKEPMKAKIVGIALSPSPGEAYYIPVAHKSITESRRRLSLDHALERLRPIIEDKKISKIGQNLKYEVVVLRNYGLNVEGISFDTMVAAHLIDSSRTSYSLSELSKIYHGHAMIEYRDVTGSGKNKLEFEDVDMEVAKDYAAEDADVAMILSKKLKPILEEAKLFDVYVNTSLKLIRVLASMEIAGVKIAPQYLRELSIEFEKGLRKVEQDIYSDVGEEFNLNSPLQLRHVLFEKLRLPKKKLTRKGEPSTDVEVLNDLSREHIVPRQLLEYRGLSKLKSTYVDALPRLINPDTGRIHTSFNQVGTSTGRISSSAPNLQNIPIKSVEGKKIREAFIPEEGFLIMSADYSQIELRLLAHFCGDESLREAFWQGDDIHSRTASELFGVSEDNVSDEMRRLAKNINFGIIYGISPFGLSKQLGTSVSIAKKYMNDYFERYSRVKGYMESSILDAQNKGYAETILGRRRPIPELQSSDRSRRGFGERAAINTPIQGSAADIIIIAMIRIQEILERRFKTRMILQVHDELLFEIHEDEVEELSPVIKGEMESAMELSVPLKVDLGIGKNWAESH